MVSAAMAHPIATRDVVSSERMLVEVRFKASFELMTTPMTQMMWLVLQLARGERDASRLNPSRSAGDTGHAVDVDIGGSSALTLSPDHPVDSVSWFEVTQSIAQWNRLSEVGDDRTLELFRAVIPDFERGDTFGLPSEAQWEYVLRGRGKLKGAYGRGDDSAELPRFAWYAENAGGHTHPVGTREARVVDGKPFYDLEGNVWEWTSDWTGYAEPRADGTDPRSVVDETSFRTDPIVRGGSFASPATGLDYFVRRGARQHEPSPVIGVRLTRYRPVPLKDYSISPDYREI